MALKTELKKVKKREQKEYSYLLREFFEIKRLFNAVAIAEKALLAKNIPQLENSLGQIGSFLRRSGRVERRMARAYHQVEMLLTDIEVSLEKKDLTDLEKIKDLVKKARIYNADLEKLDSRGGEISQLLNAVEKAAKKIHRGKIDVQSAEAEIGQKIYQTINLIKESLTDIASFEEIINQLLHIDIYLYKNAALFDQESFSEELRKMFLADQASRAPFFERLWLGLFKGGLMGVHGKVSSIDEYNTGRLKVLLEHFPIYEITEEKDLNNIWLLAQHADRDVAFQQSVLDEFMHHPQRAKVGKFIAALMDRILYVHEKKSQRFGTFITPLKNVTAFDPIEGGELQQELFVEAAGQKFIYGPLTNRSLQIINARRESLSLETLGERISKFHSPQVLMWKTSPPSF